MRSADTTAVIAAALREDDQRLTEILGQLDIEDVTRLVDAGRFIERRGVIALLTKRLAGTDHRHTLPATESHATDDDLGPSPAELGDTMTVAPGEWTPLDDHGTQIYLYGDQPVHIAFQTAEVNS